MREYVDTFDPAGGTQAPRYTLDSPCRSLLRRTLVDLFHVRARATADPQHERVQFAHDCEWVSSDRDTPFSFVWVCEQLGLDPAVVRRLYFQADAETCALAA